MTNEKTKRKTIAPKTKNGSKTKNPQPCTKLKKSDAITLIEATMVANDCIIIAANLKAART